MSLPSVLDVFAALFTARQEPESALEHFGPCDRIAPELEAEAGP